MRRRTGASSRRSTVVAALALLAVVLSSCAWMPRELNLSPLYRHRLDRDGSVLEMDVLWPIVHYERTPTGGNDFRIRPFYRYLEDGEVPPAAMPDPDSPAAFAGHEHQYLWPLGRIRQDDEQTTNRLFPFWSYTSRRNDKGQRESDWYFLFPFLWGGTRDDGAEDYFAFFPFWADIPQFFTYDRVRIILWPLYVGLEKQQRTSHYLIWPLGGWGDGPNGYRWHSLLPFWSYVTEARFRRLYLLWPFIHWGAELLDSDDPVYHGGFWPLFGRQASETGRTHGWWFLWPFFRSETIEGRRRKLDFPWPLFRFEEDLAESRGFYQWWLFPLVARTIITDQQWAWNFLWPLIWWREYQDPEGKQLQRWFLPLFWWIERTYNDGEKDDFVKIWPFYHRARYADGRSDWAFLSPWPYREGNAYGVDEAYGWFWTLAKGRQRAPDDRSVELIGNLYTSRTRGRTTQRSVPFLFNYESDDDGSVLRLFQFIPIRWGGGDEARDSTSADPR